MVIQNLNIISKMKYFLFILAVVKSFKFENDKENYERIMFQNKTISSKMENKHSCVQYFNNLSFIRHYQKYIEM